MLRAYDSLAGKEKVAAFALGAVNDFFAMKAHTEAVAFAAAFFAGFVVVADDVFVHPFTTALFGKVLAIFGAGGGVFRVVFVQDFFDGGVLKCMLINGGQTKSNGDTVYLRCGSSKYHLLSPLPWAEYKAKRQIRQ